jgi:hypothetical protein
VFKTSRDSSRGLVWETSLGGLSANVSGLCLRPFSEASLRTSRDLSLRHREIRRERSLEARGRHFCSKSDLPARGVQTSNTTTSKESLSDISRMGSRKLSRFDARQVSKRANVIFAVETAFPPGRCRQVTAQLPKEVRATFLGWRLGNSQD